MLVQNLSDRTVRETFFGYGEFVLKPGEIKDVPEEVFKLWRQPNHWGDGQCPLVRGGVKVSEPQPEPVETSKIGVEETVCRRCGRKFANKGLLLAHLKRCKGGS